MSLKRNIINFLDRRGGRVLLAKLTTSVARRELGNAATVFHNGRLWIHHINSTFFPDDQKFCYYGSSFSDWAELPMKYIADAEDYWFRHYKPQSRDVVFDIGAGRGARRRYHCVLKSSWRQGSGCRDRGPSTIV